MDDDDIVNLEFETEEEEQEKSAEPSSEIKATSNEASSSIEKLSTNRKEKTSNFISKSKRRCTFNKN
jgi:hypothetical protein